MASGATKSHIFQQLFSIKKAAEVLLTSDHTPHSQPTHLANSPTLTHKKQ
jgi:hypothetical protein